MPIPTIQFVNNSVKIIDQRKLPGKLKFVYCKDVKTLWGAIKTLAVRGAPAIGVAAGFGVLLGIKNLRTKSRKNFDTRLRKICDYIGSSRPTAVNLFNALNRMKGVLNKNPNASVSKIKQLLKKEAFAIFEEDREMCRRLGDNGAKLIKNNSIVLTICNAGALATADYGTALGVIYSAKKKGKIFKVYACETRPLLQGARLTAWELIRSKINTTLICDNTPAMLMSHGKINMVITGADRIALNGDSANKIGTYGLALLAKYHKIPFYIAAPFSTFDTSIKSGKQIPVEQRKPEEVLQIEKVQMAPKGVKVFNPAFDVTDNKLIAAIITEYGVLYPPFKRSVAKMIKKHERRK